MDNFVFCNPARIYFGKEQENHVGEIVKDYSDNILMVYGKSSIKRNGIYDRVVASLKKENINITELSGVEGNPKLDLVYKGIELCKTKNINFILAVGGGSVLDTAKGISVGAIVDHDVWDFYMRRSVPEKALPIGTVLTVVGAGSEMSNSNVINKPDGKLKRSFDNFVIIPKFSILNPELTYTVSPYQTACGSFDAMSHLMERYFTLVHHTDVTDRMIEGLLKTLMIYTPLAMKDPTNYDYRAELMWAACLAQNGLLNTGRVGDWGCHAIEHELSGEFDIPHGEGLAMITCQWMRYVYKNDVSRFVQFARRVFDVDIDSLEDEAAALEGIERLHQFILRIGLKDNVSSLNITDELADEMGEKATSISKTRGRFLKMTSEDISNIIKLSR